MRARLINEAIKPDRELFEQFKQIFREIKESGTNDPFFELNEKLNPLGIFLVDYKQHFDSIPASERANFSRSNMMPELGIRIMGFDPDTKQLFIVCDDSFDDKFVRFPAVRLNDLLNRMWSAFGHETIHMQQVDKMKTTQETDFSSMEDYYKDKQEMMAMAFSFIEEMRQFHTDEEIMDVLRTGKSLPPPLPPGMPRGFRPPSFMAPPPMQHPLYKIYKDFGGDAYKLFTKYAYKYLTQQNESNNVFKPKSSTELEAANKEFIKKMSKKYNISKKTMEYLITNGPKWFPNDNWIDHIRWQGYTGK